MNRSNHDDNLIKNLDLINFWEPFQRAQPDLKVGIRAILNDLRSKRRAIKKAAKEIDTIKLTSFEKPIAISYNTINQKAALQGLTEQLNGAFSIISEVEEYHTENRLPESYIYNQAFYYWYDMIKWFYQFDGYDKKVFESRFYNFYSVLGRYRHYYKSFLASKQNLKCYIASNDHSGLSQIGFVAARNAGIPSIYIQHAAVSDVFPPLKATYAFLDGKDAKQKYLAAGKTNTQIELMGPMKFDPYLNRPELNKQGQLVGVCLGVLNSDLEENLNLCETLENEKIPFCLRFHPQIKEGIKQPFQNRGWEFSEPKDENALEFIMRCHTIISPDSSIHLEAVILKRHSIYFTPKLHAIDYYGFVNSGLIPSAVHETHEVLRALTNKYDIKPFRRNAKKYHAGLYTEWEGKSTERIVRRIREITKM